MDDLLRVLLARDYNTRVVLMGTSLLGICGGVVGTFMLLRKRSLVSDVVGHASLPGIAIAFLVMEMLSPGKDRSMSELLVGALVAGLLGILCTTAIRRYTRIKEDAAYAIVLSIFFGAGVALFTVIQRIPSESIAGLNHFIFGQSAAMLARDVKLIAAGSVIVLAVIAIFFKEFAFLCFDEESAAAVGLPVVALDLTLMGLVVAVSIIGLQSVGMLLVVAILIAPAAAARFWTNDLMRMTIIAGAFGALSAVLGVMTSTAFQRIAAGSVIVLFGSLIFLFSLLFGSERGVVRRAIMHRGLSKRIGRHDLLRAIYEEIEPLLTNAGSPSQAEITNRPFAFDRLLQMRAWNAAELERYLRDAMRAGLIVGDHSGNYRLTPEGATEAQRVVREHRLWELYLINYADVAPGMVDRDADRIEHALEPEVVAELTSMLSARFPQKAMPPSPHPIEPANTN